MDHLNQKIDKNANEFGSALKHPVRRVRTRWVPTVIPLRFRCTILALR